MKPQAQHYSAATAGTERDACSAIEPAGFHLRAPPPPHELGSAITPDADLFETIHMGAAVVDPARWRLLVDGMVKHPFTLNLAELMALPSVTVTAFHECYGSPLQPPKKALWRVGCVRWSGVPLAQLLARAEPAAEARFVWSEGLDHGQFAGRQIDRYQKDLPLPKALAAEVLVAYALNGEPLRKERGGPVRLVVPGWFGTNMTKWLCRLSVQAQRAPGPFTTDWYNEVDAATGVSKPVWAVEPNSMIVSPAPGATVAGGAVLVRGWAWSTDGIAGVEVSTDHGGPRAAARLAPRVDFGWQAFESVLDLGPGRHRLSARATCASGATQPLAGRRNHVHSVSVNCVSAA